MWRNSLDNCIIETFDVHLIFDFADLRPQDMGKKD